MSSFALSKHNFSRGSNLINILKKILFDFLINSEQINNFNFSVKFIGNLKFLAKKDLQLIKKFESKNQKCKKNFSKRNLIQHKNTYSFVSSSSY